MLKNSLLIRSDALRQKEQEDLRELSQYLRGCPADFCFIEGLCTNVYLRFKNGFIDALFDNIVYSSIKINGWEHYSNNEKYPIQHPTVNNPYQAFKETENKYIGEYGRRRIELANMVADELEKILEAA